MHLFTFYYHDKKDQKEKEHSKKESMKRNRRGMKEQISEEAFYELAREKRSSTAPK